MEKKGKEKRKKKANDDQVQAGCIPSVEVSCQQHADRHELSHKLCIGSVRLARESARPRITAREKDCTQSR